jgi:hypothetical protein
MMVGTKVRQVDWVNVLQTSESKIKPGHQHQLLPKESKFGQKID